MENLTLFDLKPYKKTSIFDKFKSTCPLCGASKKQLQNCEGTQNKNIFRFPVCYDEPFYYHQQRLIKKGSYE